MSQYTSRILLANLFRCSKAGVSCVGFSRLIRLPKRHERDKNFAILGSPTVFIGFSRQRPRSRNRRKIYGSDSGYKLWFTQIIGTLSKSRLSIMLKHGIRTAIPDIEGRDFYLLLAKVGKAQPSRAVFPAPVTIAEKETGIYWVCLTNGPGFSHGRLPAKLPAGHLEGYYTATVPDKMRREGMRKKSILLQD